RSSTCGSKGTRVSIGGSLIGAGDGTSTGDAGGPGIWSGGAACDRSCGACGHEMMMGGPSTPDARCGRSVPSTTAVHTPACTSTAAVRLGIRDGSAMRLLDAISRSNMEIPRESVLHQHGIRGLRWDGSRLTN